MHALTPPPPARFSVWQGRNHDDLEKHKEGNEKTITYTLIGITDKNNLYFLQPAENLSLSQKFQCST